MFKSKFNSKTASTMEVRPCAPEKVTDSCQANYNRHVWNQNENEGSMELMDINFIQDNFRYSEHNINQQ